jgi:1-piperideine-2-carboxylate/1-pyrroline-2-carboxylate reductase [NAD(P)H]
VSAYDATTGALRFVLDGPTVTGRRTAAVTALGIQALHGAAPRDILLIGTGKQAANHAEALAAIFPAARLRARFARAAPRRSAPRIARRRRSSRRSTATRFPMRSTSSSR